MKMLAVGLQFTKKETLEQVFSCEFCEISKNTFFYRIPLVTASEFWLMNSFFKHKYCEIGYVEQSEKVTVVKKYMLLISSSSEKVAVWKKNLLRKSTCSK